MIEIVNFIGKLTEYLKINYTGKEELVYHNPTVMEDAGPYGYVNEELELPNLDLDTCACSAEARPEYECQSKRSLKFFFSRSENLDRLVNSQGKTFSEKLFEMIDAKGMTEVEVYTKANLDRRLFSKLRRKTHTPSKNTVLALIMGLELNMAEAKELLSYAGYAFKPSSAVDMIVSFFIEEGEYDLFTLNTVLEGYGLELLGNTIK